MTNEWRPTCGLCVFRDLSPEAKRHVEGLKVVAISPECPSHGDYLKLPGAEEGNGTFSVELMAQLEAAK